MRDRHIPRLCDSCGAPMARQEAACWHCGTQWADEDVPRTALRVIAGGAETRAGVMPADIDADRWITDGGSFDSETAVQVRLSTARR
jgi:hypothetical protein